MAYTINKQPRKFSPIGNPMYSVVSSTNDGSQVNFKYICDIYIDGATSYTYRMKVPSTSPGYGIFDVSSLVKNHVTSDFSIEDTGVFKTNANSYCSVVLKYGEEYGTTPTVYANMATSGTIYAHNANIDFIDFPSYDHTQYVLDELGTLKKFLTNSPRTLNIGRDENAFVYMMTDDEDAVTSLQVIAYNSAGIPLGSDYIANPYYSAVGDEMFLRAPAGTRNLTIPYLGSSITNTASYYIVSTVNGFTQETSETIRFNITDACTPYETYRLHFLNRRGGYDSFTFNRLSRNNIDVTRNKYKKNVGSFNSSTETFSYSKDERGTKDYSIFHKEKFLLNSDWIDEDTSTWLEELVTSPDVFVEVDGDAVAINITDTSYEKKKTANDKLINITLNVEYSHLKYR